jgi:hypothetical protein
MSTAEELAVRYVRALANIVAVLGPEQICSCAFPDCGLPEEASEALRIAKEAIAGAPQPDA